MDPKAQIDTLTDQFGHQSGIEFKQFNELVAVVINNNKASSTVFLQGAQVADYSPKNEQPVLWLSDKCDYKQGSPLRGGIPICWPWFGDLQRNPEQVKNQYNTDQPAHGFVRKKLWQLESIDCSNPETTKLLLSLNIDASEAFPYAVSLSLAIEVSDKLKLTLSVTNKGSSSLSFTSALHSYFNISDIRNATIKGLESVSYLDTLDNWLSKKNTASLTIKSEVDRIYPDIPETIHLRDHGFNRSISISHTEPSDMVVWNPWIEKSKRLGQFADSDYQEMICLESANILQNYCELKPDQQYRATITISTDSL